AVDFLIGRLLPDGFAGGGIEAIDETGAADDIKVGRGNEDAIPDDGGGGGEIAGGGGGFAEGPEDFGSGWAVDAIGRAGAGLVGAVAGPVCGFCSLRGQRRMR